MEVSIVTVCMVRVERSALAMQHHQKKSSIELHVSSDHELPQDNTPPSITCLHQAHARLSTGKRARVMRAVLTLDYGVIYI